jgi:hypothetical protein
MNIESIMIELQIMLAMMMLLNTKIGNSFFENQGMSQIWNKNESPNWMLWITSYGQFGSLISNHKNLGNKGQMTLDKNVWHNIEKIFAYAYNL